METHRTEAGSASSEPTRISAVIIANPASGTFPHHTQHYHETLTFLQQQGWQVELWYTQAAGDARRIAQQAVEQGVNVVIAAGGDGTINEIIQALAGSETTLGVLPSGTVNVWAREMGIPLDAVGARQVLIEGRTRRIDLGRVNQRYFLLMVGIGFDGEIARAVEKKPLKRLGVLGYALAALWFGPGYIGFPVVLRMDDAVVKTRALQIFIGNTQLYAGAFKFTWRARCDDGLLDLCIVRKRGLWGRIIVLRDFILRRERRRLWVRYETFTEMKIDTSQPVAIQIDGEAAGHTPATVAVAAGALKVIVPQRVPDGLFAEE